MVSAPPVAGGVQLLKNTHRSTNVSAHKPTVYYRERVKYIISVKTSNTSQPKAAYSTGSGETKLQLSSV